MFLEPRSGVAARGFDVFVSGLERVAKAESRYAGIFRRVAAWRWWVGLAVQVTHAASQADQDLVAFGSGAQEFDGASDCGIQLNQGIGRGRSFGGADDDQMRREGWAFVEQVCFDQLGLFVAIWSDAFAEHLKIARGDPDLLTVQHPGDER